MGGWYDAGDFDIQANSVLNTTQDLAYIWREFKPMRDQTLIDQKTQYADIHVPDGVPDNVELIMHGTLNINATSTPRWRTSASWRRSSASRTCITTTTSAMR